MRRALLLAGVLALGCGARPAAVVTGRVAEDPRAGGPHSVPDAVVTLELRNPGQVACRVTGYELRFGQDGRIVAQGLAIAVPAGATERVTRTVANPAVLGRKAGDIQVVVTAQCP
jgi:hypothetical protein